MIVLSPSSPRSDGVLDVTSSDFDIKSSLTNRTSPDLITIFFVCFDESRSSLTIRTITFGLITILLVLTDAELILWNWFDCDVHGMSCNLQVRLYVEVIVTAFVCMPRDMANYCSGAGYHFIIA